MAQTDEIEKTKIKNINFSEDVKLKKEKFDNKGGSVLGILEGPIADTEHATRNGRTYSKELWDQVFSNDLVQEQFDETGVLGELDHPANRDETLLSEVAVKLSEKPILGNDGLLRGKFEILNTPKGQIVYQLARSGCALGISSRGSGNLDDVTGEVDPGTFSFEGFDVVYMPAVKDARTVLISEGKGSKAVPVINPSYRTYNLFCDRMNRIINKAETPELKEELKKGYISAKRHLYENLDDPQEWTDFLASNPKKDTNVKFNWQKYGKYFDKNGKLVDKAGYEAAMSELTKEAQLQNKNSFNEIEEDTKQKKNGKWVNKGKEGEHGEFNTKKEADAQRKAMFARGYHESAGGSSDSLRTTLTQAANELGIKVPSIADVDFLNEPNTMIEYEIDWEDADYDPDDDTSDPELQGIDTFDSFDLAYIEFRLLVNDNHIGHATLDAIVTRDDKKTSYPLYTCDIGDWGAEVDALSDQENFEETLDEDVNGIPNDLFTSITTAFGGDSISTLADWFSGIKKLQSEGHSWDEIRSIVNSACESKDKSLFMKAVGAPSLNEGAEKSKENEKTEPQDSETNSDTKSIEEDPIEEFNAKLISFLHSFGGKDTKYTEDDENKFVDLFSTTFPEVIDFISENCEDKKESGEEGSPDSVGNTEEGDDALYVQLSDIVEENAKLKTKLEQVQSEKAAINDRVKALEESSNLYKSTSESLTTKVDGLHKENLELQNKNILLRENSRKTSDRTKEVNSLKEQLNALKESSISKEQLNQTKSSLEEQIQQGKKELTQCKHALDETLSKYIEKTARSIGATVGEITNKLPKDYTVDDVDEVAKTIEEEYIRFGGRTTRSQTAHSLKGKQVEIESISRTPLVNYSKDDELRDNLQEAMIRLSKNK